MMTLSKVWCLFRETADTCSWKGSCKLIGAYIFDYHRPGEAYYLYALLSIRRCTCYCTATQAARDGTLKWHILIKECNLSDRRGQ
jgi:hypothetical protein